MTRGRRTLYLCTVHCSSVRNFQKSLFVVRIIQKKVCSLFAIVCSLFVKSPFVVLQKSVCCLSLFDKLPLYRKIRICRLQSVADYLFRKWSLSWGSPLEIVMIFRTSFLPGILLSRAQNAFPTDGFSSWESQKITYIYISTIFTISLTVSQFLGHLPNKFR